MFSPSRTILVEELIIMSGILSPPEVDSDWMAPLSRQYNRSPVHKCDDNLV